MRRLPVRFRPEALRDLHAISVAIAESSASAQVASAYTKRLRERCERIGDAPFGGRARDELRPGLRTIAYKRSVVIAYTIRDDHVEIAKIFMRGRKYEDLFSS
ncbi:type II toxin-antitoxin system RelE/ParE family toxin [Salinarimonas chemoclinalis]|uniref:type II toxin-antitoxin system RelE/ParE family toxin n=1 Tax=Salinarimonas chemoclinalis TaxID=3241599 RepID=UPI0035592B24